MAERKRENFKAKKTLTFHAFDHNDHHRAPTEHDHNLDERKMDNFKNLIHASDFIQPSY